jgi:hypothetical protein
MLGTQTFGHLMINDDGIPISIVARESSELASRLRSQGWIARSGWRSTSRDNQRDWLIRFEHPAVSSSNVAG